MLSICKATAALSLGDDDTNSQKDSITRDLNLAWLGRYLFWQYYHWDAQLLILEMVYAYSLKVHFLFHVSHVSLLKMKDGQANLMRRLIIAH